MAIGCSKSRDRQQLDYGREREAALQGIAKCYLWFKRSLYLAILVSPREDGSLVIFLPLDWQLNRKLAWSAIYQAFTEAPLRPS